MKWKSLYSNPIWALNLLNLIIIHSHLTPINLFLIYFVSWELEISKICGKWFKAGGLVKGVHSFVDTLYLLLFCYPKSRHQEVHHIKPEMPVFTEVGAYITFSVYIDILSLFPIFTEKYLSFIGFTESSCYVAKQNIQSRYRAKAEWNVLWI